MRPDPLQRLYQAAAALPGDVFPVALPMVSTLPPGQAEGSPDVEPLRQALGALLLELANRVDPLLVHALTRASGVWDQVDAFTVMDTRAMDRVGDLRAWCAQLRGHPDDAVRSAALEAATVLEASVGILALVERRLATLVRLRLRDPESTLMVDDRPFLDLGAALKAAGRAFQ